MGRFLEEISDPPPRGGHSQADGWRTVARGGVGGVTVSGVLGIGQRCVCVVCVCHGCETFRAGYD